MQEGLDFTHLHLHTTYSMLDGAIHISELMKRVKELGMNAVAITDHGNMYGAIEFYKEAVKHEIKPIIGSEFYVSPSRNKEEELEQIADGGNYHLILLAKNEIGYQNLIKLSSRSFTEGFYRKPRIDYDLLSGYTEGLIWLTACLAGEVNRKILEGKEEKSFELAHRLNEMFRGEDFYLEIQDHGIPEQHKVAQKIIEFSKKTNIPLVLTNDSHFLNKDDKEAQDILLRIGTQKTIQEEMRFGFNEEFYVKSPAEMFQLYPDYREAFYNTNVIRDKCSLTFKFGNPLLPKFDVPEGYDTDSYLEKLVWDGIKERYATVTEEVKQRTEFELNTIKKMNFAGYFLIVQDYINFARRSGIPVGPGRGSAAGSIIAYALGITNVDPIKYNLLFERFLNPDRKDMPDIDTDFCVERREEVINYIKRKYGEDRVGQIITFSSLAAKNAIKDVARVFNVSFTDANELTKTFPNKLGISIQEALETSKDLRDVVEKSEINKKIFQIAQKLEGNYRQPGRHAAGVVIAPSKLEDAVPLATVAEKGKDSRSIVTQYDKNMLEAVGLIKMDILGLKNLTTIKHTVDLIYERRGIKLDIDKIPLDDPNTFALLRKANVLGVFQLDSSSGIRDLFAKAQVQKFEEIAALLALYRPGPMGSGMLDDYLERKSGRKKVTYPHPSLEEILKETYGVVVYQEQVMGISRVLGGFSVGDSDVLRKAMAKKDKKKLPELKEKFIKGAVQNGHNEKFATELFEQLEKFGEYGFNKSHSVAYAFVTYQTAYLKANYTIEYMTALLAGDHGRTTDIVKYINNCRDMDIRVLGPDIKDSGVSFKIVSDDCIRFGLSSVKGVGEMPADGIVQARNQLKNFSILEDFLRNVEMKHINRKTLEALIYAGAFDSFGYSRKCLYENIDYLISFAQEEQRRKAEGSIGLFGETVNYNLQLPLQAEEWELEEKLKLEKSVTGVFLTGHPLDKYKRHLKSLAYTTIEKMEELSSGAKVDFCGVVTKIEIRYNKKNEEFVNFKVEDYTGEIDCTLFHKNYLKYKDLLKEDQILFFNGNLDKIEVGEAEVKGQILVNTLEKLNDEVLEKKLEKSLHIVLQPSSDLSIINQLYAILTSFKGNSNVFFHIKNGGEEKKVIKAHPHYNIEPNKELFHQLKTILQPNSVFYSIGEDLRKVW
ncbi:MAG: DNA polymerase III subunit alpha [Leptospiraceae bacterium]|nr:DNA polymerase III subunit alpha [Leptospiraceae bacterium]